MPEEQLSYKHGLAMRRKVMAKSCKLHYDVAPLKVVRGNKQYLYDDQGVEYLDCYNSTAHVGHCHPHVTYSGQQQLGKLCNSNGFLTDAQTIYAKRLVETLPDCLCVCFFTNSGSEANDLALRLARAHTKKKDIMVVEGSYHGNLENLINISHRLLRKCPGSKKEYVHVAPVPDIYRGKHRDDPQNAAIKYAHEVKLAINKIQDQGRQLAAFIQEPIMVCSGVIVPPKNYLRYVYQHVREAGGVCIANEVQTGLGRVGDHFWAFQSQDVIPDIVTCGKPLGNGYPCAVVITTPEIADSLDNFGSAFGGNPMSCAMGSAVLDVIKNEQLLSSAKCVGRILVEGFRNMMPRHPMMGDVRGQGLVVAIEIVVDKESRKPAHEAAELLSYKLKQDKIILANDGPDKNVMIITPPMCFTCDNARYVLAAFDKLLAEIECGINPNQYEQANEHTLMPQITELDIMPHNLVISSSEDEDEGVTPKRAKYEDMD